MQKAAYHHGDLQAALIAAGLELLAARNADALSLREVARAVAVSATAVYRHFPDKGALMATLAREGFERLAAAQHAAFDAAVDDLRFEATGRAYVQFALENPALFRLMFTSARPEAKAAGELAEAMRFLRANVAGIAGAGADDETISVLALRAWALAHGLAMLMLDGQVDADPAVLEAVFDQTLALTRSS